MSNEMSNENNDRIQATPAVFLPGQLHDTDNYFCVLYLNDVGYIPVFEVSWYTAADILKAADAARTFRETEKYYYVFWGELNGASQTKFECVQRDSFAGRELAANYPTADFIGGGLEEIEFLVRWAKNYARTRAC